jgi:TatD DNase family protein
VIDSHVHLNRREFAADRAAVLERAEAAGVELFLEVGYDLASSEAAVRAAAADPRVLATVGVHPHDATELADAEGNVTPAGGAGLARLRELAAHPRVVAVGEIGLDFYRDLSPRPAQRTALRAQLELADAVGLPVVFHTRDAYPELMALLDDAGVPARGAVLHSFAGDERAVAWARYRGVRLGVGGPLTYKNSRLPAVLARAELDDLLLETDCPWLPPVPYRGQRNEPAYLQHTRDRLAEVFGVSPAEVERRTDAGFRALFAPPVAGAPADTGG